MICLEYKQDQNSILNYTIKVQGESPLRSNFLLNHFSSGTLCYLFCFVLVLVLFWLLMFKDTQGTPSPCQGHSLFSSLKFVINVLFPTGIVLRSGKRAESKSTKEAIAVTVNLSIKQRDVSEKCI